MRCRHDREVARLVRAAEAVPARGFDGLFLDNTDMVEPRRHRPQRAGMARLVAMLDDFVHDEGGLLFTQNGARGMLRGYPRQEVEPLASRFAIGEDALPYVADIGLTRRAVKANPPDC
jgi:hypothetical protein